MRVLGVFGTSGTLKAAIHGALVLTAILAPAACALAQTEGGIGGWVKDKETGDPIGGAWLDIVGPKHGKGVTSGAGWWLCPDLPPGVYTVNIAHPGYKAMSETVQLRAATWEIVHFDLERGAGGVTQIPLRSVCWRVQGPGEVKSLKKPVKVGERTLKLSAEIDPALDAETQALYAGHVGFFKSIRLWCRPLHCATLRIAIADDDGTQAEWNLGPETLKYDWNEVSLDPKKARITSVGKDGAIGNVQTFSFSTGSPSDYPKAGTYAWYFNDIRVEH